MHNGIKLVVIGGGSAYTPALVQNLIDKKSEILVKELWLVDVVDQKERLNIISSFSKRLLKHNQVEMDVFLSFDQKEALVDADFVITQMNVGMDESDLLDEKICYDHQVYANELYGVSSVFKALRTVPVIYSVIEDMNHLCEKAWLINISQPMGLISEAVIRYAEFDKYIGISHIPYQMNACFSDLLKVKPSQLILCAAGLSPMSYITNVYKNQKDIFDDIMNMIQQQENACCWPKEFLKDLGVFPSMDLKYVYNQKEEMNQFITDYENNKSTALKKKEKKEMLYQMYQDESLNHCPELLTTSEGIEDSYKAIELMSSILNDKRDYQIVNTINNGHIFDLPEGSAIEITSRITKDGPMPVHISRLPNQVKGLLQHIKAFEELLADAIYEKNLDKASLALHSHPLMYSNKDIRSCFQAFKKQNKKYLTYYQKGEKR